jgi:hypothetical protein
LAQAKQNHGWFELALAVIFFGKHIKKPAKRWSFSFFNFRGFNLYTFNCPFDFNFSCVSFAVTH